MDLEIEFATSMAAVDRASWDSLAAPHGSPLLSWGFLALLEESGSIVPERGWGPNHLLVRRGGALVAAAPFYLRSHSMGDFVFDFAFARAAEGMGKAWYPKLVGMVPATPSPAWRVLAAEGEEGEALTALVLDSAARAARAAGLAGIHLNWVDIDLARRLPGLRGAPSFAPWEHQAFLWTDAGYGDFGGYLASLSKNMRRNALREREAVRAAGIATRVIEAEEASARPALLARMAELYEDTNDRFGPWGAKFLTRDFFLRLPEFLPAGWILSAAFEAGAGDDDPLALAFLLKGKDRLYGRYWGTRRFADGLHFELCYWLPIEYALRSGIASFDPGMGSEHKARRGFASSLAPSLHLAFDRRLQALLEANLPAWNAEEAAGVEGLNRELPFKRGTPSPRGLPAPRVGSLDAAGID